MANSFRTNVGYARFNIQIPIKQAGDFYLACLDELRDPDSKDGELIDLWLRERAKARGEPYDDGRRAPRILVDPGAAYDVDKTKGDGSTKTA